MACGCHLTVIELAHDRRQYVQSLDAVPIVAVRKLGTRFALTYAAIAAVLFGIYAFPFELFGAQQDWLAGYLAAYAKLAGGLLGLFGADVTVTGAVIHGRFPLEIVRNCDAIELNILFASALLAFPASCSAKLPLLAAGLCSLLAINVLRICALYCLGTLSPAAFRLAHEEVFPLLLVAATAVVFLLCLQRLEPQARDHVSREG